MGCEWQRRRQTQSRRTGSCPRQTQTSLVSSSLLVVPPPPPLDLAAVAVNRATHPLSFTPHSFVPSLLEPPRIPASSSLLLHPSSLLASYSSKFPFCTYLTLCLALVSLHVRALRHSLMICGDTAPPRLNRLPQRLDYTLIPAPLGRHGFVAQSYIHELIEYHSQTFLFLWWMRRRRFLPSS